MSIRKTASADNAGFEPLNAGAILIDVVNDGNGAVEVPEFAPIRAELLVLVKHWDDIFLGRAYCTFCNPADERGVTDIELCRFAEGRVRRIIGLVGQDAIQAVRKVRNAMAKRIGLREWKEFCDYLGRNHLHGETPAGSPEKTGQRS